MRKITILLAFLFFIGANFANAQTRTISGKVTGASDGAGIPGVTVQVQGTTIGTVTDIDGNYTLDVAPDAESLVYKYVGMKTVVIAIGDQKTIFVAMDADAVMMGEVVVTALGISREKKSLGYSVQEVESNDIVKGASTNAVNSLSGRVAGVSISNSSGNMAGSSRVLIRGAASMLGNNEPLYVVDGIPIDNSSYNTRNEQRGAGGTDFGNMAQDINPDDIESVTVLKGASAAALYGSRASNGVIMITTKKGKQSNTESSKIGVTINTGITAEQVLVLPKYQNTYGGGYYPYFDTNNVAGTDLLTPYYGADESWGPKMEGQQVYAWWNVYDYEQGITAQPETSAWNPQPDNVKNFFNTGLAFRNNVAVYGGDDVRNFKAGWTNLSRSGVFPGSKLTRNTFNFNAMSKFGEKLSVTVGGTYVVNDSKALPENGYGDNSIMQKFSQWGQRSWDMEQMGRYKNPDGTQRTWNRTSINNPTPAYSDNPYWTQYENYNTNKRDRFFGNVNVKYDITDFLNVTGAFYADRYTDRRTTQAAIYSAAESFYNLQIRQFAEYNGEMRVNFDKMVSETIRLSAFVGFNMRDQKYNENLQTTTGGLSIPDFYSLANSNGPIDYTDYKRHRKTNSVFASVSADWKSMVYLNVTGRNDWSSTLPPDAWSYFYPAASASVVFTEIAGLKDNSIIDFGQVRLSWAKVGSDTDPYRLYSTYFPETLFGSNPRYTLPSELNNSQLTPEFTTSMEVGLNMKFLRNRLGFDFTYYDASTTDQIFPVDISAASGYTSMIRNAGEIRNKGIELLLYGSPIRNNDFSWDITLNFTKNNNEVVSLEEGIDVISLASLWGVYVTATAGQPYGMLRGSNFVTDDAGNLVVGSDGTYLKSQEIEDLGSVLPDWNAGIQNTFSYKDFSLGFLVDIQEGGSLFSTTNMFGSWTGIFEESVGLNARGVEQRLPVSEGGGVLIENAVIGHFDADGNVVVDNPTNDVYVDAYDNALSNYFGPRAKHVFSTRYVKLRDVSFTWKLPRKWMSGTFIYGASLSLHAGNLAIWNSDLKHIDPEQATNSGNIQGIEGGANPSTRTFGFNLKVDF